MQKLTEKERAEIKKKLVEVRDSYGSGQNVLKHILQLLNKTIRMFGDIQLSRA